MRPRIGLLGCGRWGRLILRDLLAMGAEVHFACRTEASAELARRAGARSAATALPAADGLDAYIVATPTITHAAVLEALVATGKPIFVEKPMTADLASARRLAALAPDRLFVMDKWRYHPAVEAMRAQVAAGAVGRVLALRASRWQWSNPHTDVSVLWILAPHDLAIALHVLGRIPPLSHAFPLARGRPDLGFTAVLQDDEVQVTLDVGAVETGHRRQHLLVGERATLELTDAYDERLRMRRGPPASAAAVEEFLPISREMPLESELAAFLAHVRGEGPPPLSSVQDGLLIVERLADIERALAAP